MKEKRRTKPYKIALIAIATFAGLVAIACFLILNKRGNDYEKENRITAATVETINSYRLDMPMDYPLVSPVFKSEDLVNIGEAREKENPDLYAYIKSEDGTLDYPVMMCEDSDKYINTDFFGNESEYGCLFVSNETVYDGSRNMIINGHHMKNGKMFGDLEKYINDRNYHKKNGYVKLITDSEIQVYEVCAAVTYSVNDKNALAKSTYYSEDSFNEFKEAVKDKGIIFSDFNYDDKTLSLITCEYSHNDGRLMVIYKLTKTQPL